MSIFDKQRDLENLPDQLLIQLGQDPNPQYPSYLVMAEVERRRDMRQRHEAEMAKHQAANPPDIATQRMDELGGIAGVDPAMGQGPPPEDMAALQGGIAGGPPPGMEQMGGPPPGMEGQPPMMAYGGLIPGYQNGGAYPDPDEDGFLRGLWDEYGQPYIEEKVENIRDFPNRGIFTEEGRRRRREGLEEFERLSPEEQQQFMMEQIEGSGAGVLEAIGPGAATKGIMSLGRAVWPSVSRRLPGAVARSTRALAQRSKSLDEAARTARATADAMKKGQRGVVRAREIAEEAERAARVAARKLTRRPQAIEMMRKTRQAGRGLTRRLLGGIADLYKKHPWKMGAGTAGALDWYGGEDPNRAAGGLIPGYHEGHLVSGHGSGPGQHLADEDPEGSGGTFDPSDQGWLVDRAGDISRGIARLAGLPFRIAGAALPSDVPIPLGEWAERTGEEYSPAGARRREREERAELLDSMAQADDPAAVALAEAERLRLAREEARRIRDEDRAYRRRWVDEAQGATDTYLSRLQDPSPERIERREFWETEADDETNLLARELGLSTERVDELRREMRTEKETDHARKARLFSGLGAALMGSPRNLGESLKGTTTGLEDLDEELRVERRRDLGDVYTQRARGLSAERSGRAGIRSLRDKRYADIIELQTAGEGPAYQGMMDIYGRAMSTDAQLEAQQLALQRGLEQARMQMGQFNPADWPHMEAIIADLLRKTGPDGLYADPDVYADLQRQVGQLPQVLMSATLRPLLGGLPQVVDRVDVPVGVYPDNQ